MRSAKPAKPQVIACTPMPAILLTWTASARSTSYRIYRGTRAGGEGMTPLATVAALSYLDTSVSVGLNYFYQVSAVNSFGVSHHSNEASATISAGGDAVNLILGSSTDPSVNGGSITLYATVAPT